jgi:FkbM family methyltransferase
MKNQIVLLLRYLNRWGIFSGLRIFISRNYFDEFKFNKSTLRLRRHSSDAYIFDQIFIDKEYQVNTDNAHFIIDAGSNIGITSIFFKIKYPGATIVCIEPDAGNFSLLKKNMVDYKDVYLFDSALWNEKTQLGLVSAQSYDSHYVTNNHELNNQTVNTITIDDILNKFDKQIIDILKIDIEGAEKEVFEKNYETWLPNVKVLMIEMHDKFKFGCSKSVFKALCNYNFSIAFQGEIMICVNKDL